MIKKKYKVVELFSGIGSQAKALEKIGADFEIVNTCEWNINSAFAYNLIHGNYQKHDNNLFTKDQITDMLFDLGVSGDGKESLSCAAIRSIHTETLNEIYNAIKDSNNLVDISSVKGRDLADKIDIMTYSFPCQDLSNVGNFHGYNKGIDRDAGSRSGLLWEVERILFERYEEDYFLPKFLVMENVPALNSPRHRKNFQEWQQQLNKLGYYNKLYKLNAKDFGLPQNRERLIMISIMTDGDADIENDLDNYFEMHDLNDKEYIKTMGIKRKHLRNLLRVDYSDEKYKKEALECQPNDTESRRRIWEDNLQITDNEGNIIVDMIPTITTKQDRHPNSGNLRVPFKNGKSKFRYLTPRECFLLMGFDESDFDTLIEHNIKFKRNSKLFTRDKLIKMAGNSIAVNVLEAVFKQIIDIDGMLFFS